jgi:hypothetical protein
MKSKRNSILLGSKDRNEVKELLRARDYETLTTDYVVNKKGLRRPVSMSDAYYSQFAVKFTGSSCFNLAETSTLFRSVVYVARRFFANSGEIYDDGQVREFLMWLLKPSTSVLYKYNYQFRAVLSLLLIMAVLIICLNAVRLCFILSLLISGRVQLMMISCLLVVLIRVLRFAHSLCMAYLILSN